MVQFMQENKALGVESMCKELAIAPSTYYRHVQLQRHPERRGAQVRQREARLVEIKRVYDESNGIYGARKVWRQLLREGITMAHGTVERLMRRAGLQGVWRGKGKRTTVSEGRSDLPDLVKRDFSASRPNQLWVADFTCVPTRSGYVYTAFVIDVYSRYIVGWRVMRSMETTLVSDALEQALHARGMPDGLTHHSDRGSQYLSLRYSARLEEAGVKASVGTVGDSCDNALAESIIGLYKTEVIERQGWCGAGDVELSTLEWVDWFNQRRLLSSIGYTPPAEFEAAYYRQKDGLDKAA